MIEEQRVRKGWEEKRVAGQGERERKGRVGERCYE